MSYDKYQHVLLGLKQAHQVAIFQKRQLFPAPNTFAPNTISKIPKILFIPEMKIQNWK